MKIAIGCDHGALDLKNVVIAHLEKAGHEVKDFGTYTLDSCDYPDFAGAAAKAVAAGECERGIVLCTTGIGVSITANKVKGIRCALLSDLMSEVSRRLDDEAKAENRKMVVLDTIENLAVRSYTRVMYSDSLIRVKRLKDTTKLHIRLSDIVPGEYTVSFTYLIDTLDENRNSRVEAYLLTHDTMESLRHSMMLSRYREGKYSRKFKADTVHNELVVNMFYHPKHEEAKKPDITINNFKIVRVLPDEVAVDSLYHEQLNIRLINHELMSAFTADSLAVEEIVPDSLAAERDSLMLTERDSLAIERDRLAGENEARANENKGNTTPTTK